jgi:hypothetical protein
LAVLHLALSAGLVNRLSRGCFCRLGTIRKDVGAAEHTLAFALGLQRTSQRLATDPVAGLAGITWGVIVAKPSKCSLGRFMGKPEVELANPASHHPDGRLEPAPLPRHLVE